MQLRKRLGMRKQGSLGTILEALYHIGVYSRETKINIHKKTLCKNVHRSLFTLLKLETDQMFISKNLDKQTGIFTQ